MRKSVLNSLKGLVLIAVVAGGIWLAGFCRGRGLHDDFELVVSRCRDALLRDVSPDGRYLLALYQFPENKNLLIDTITGEEIFPPSAGTHYFVNNELLLSVRRDGMHLWDIQTKEIFPLARFKESDDWAVAFSKADVVYAVEYAHTAVALDADFRAPGAVNYAVYFGTRRESIVEIVSAEIGAVEVKAIDRIGIQCNKPEGCPSHNGQMAALSGVVKDRDGNFIAWVYKQGLSTPSLIYGWAAIAGWAADDSGVYLNFGHGHLLRGDAILPPMINIPGGIIKLKVPEKYWAGSGD